MSRQKQPEAYELIAHRRNLDASLVAKVWKEAIKQKVDPFVALAVVQWESGYKPEVTHKNPDGSVDYGLFQLNSRYHPQFKNDVDNHIAYGVKFLADRIKTYGLVKGLGVYNAGSAPAAEAARQRYAKKVLPLVRDLQSALTEDPRRTP